MNHIENSAIQTRCGTVSFASTASFREQFGENHWNAWTVYAHHCFITNVDGTVELIRINTSNLPKEEPFFKTVTLDGKRIAYTSDTEFLIQVGHGKGSYKTRYSFKGNFGQAFMHYQGINIGKGYKKRLVIPSSKNPIIARQFS